MNLKPEFNSKSTVLERDWGTEEILVVSPKKWMMKRLSIKKGCRGGLQFHRLKDEGGMILSGSLKVTYSTDGKTLETIILGKGETFRFPPGIIHQEEALTDVVIIECTTPHLNDRVRVEKQFGLGFEEGGLPSTSIKDIKFI